MSFLEKLLRSKPFVITVIVLPGLWPVWPLWLRPDPSVLADPLKYVLHHLGFVACLLLAVVLAFTPLRVLFPKWGVALALNRHRRLVGVSAFVYAALHFTTHLVYEGGFAILASDIKKPFLVTGLIAFAILLVLVHHQSARRRALARRKTLEKSAPSRLRRRRARRLPSGGGPQNLSPAGPVDLRAPRGARTPATRAPGPAARYDFSKCGPKRLKLLVIRLPPCSSFRYHTAFMKKIPLLLALILSIALRAAPETQFLPAAAAPANARVAAVQVRVIPDHANWAYALGEPAKFQVNLICDHEPVGGLTIKYSVGPEKMPTEEKTAIVPADGLTIEAGTMQAPGFLRCVVTVELNGKTYRNLATAGFAPEKIQPTQVEPADFDAFWAEGKAELAKIPLDARLTLQPDLCSSTVEVYHVSFQNVGTPSTTIPFRTHPHLRHSLHSEGPGSVSRRAARSGRHGKSVQRRSRARGKRTDHARRSAFMAFPSTSLRKSMPNSCTVPSPAIRPTISIIKQPIIIGAFISAVCGPTIFSARWKNGTAKICSSWVAARAACWAIVTAALDPRVIAISSSYPAFCDVTGYLHGRAGGWPGMMREASAGQRTPEKIATPGYYDAFNFARRLKVPGFYTWGYNDETCPPTSMFAAYNVISAPKQLLLALEMGHGTSPEQLDRVNTWILAQAGVKSDGAR